MAASLLIGKVRLELKPFIRDIARPQFGRTLHSTDFWSVSIEHQETEDSEEDHDLYKAYGLLRFLDAVTYGKFPTPDGHTGGAVLAGVYLLSAIIHNADWVDPFGRVTDEDRRKQLVDTFPLGHSIMREILLHYQEDFQALRLREVLEFFINDVCTRIGDVKKDIVILPEQFRQVLVGTLVAPNEMLKKFVEFIESFSDDLGRAISSAESSNQVITQDVFDDMVQEIFTPREPNDALQLQTHLFTTYGTFLFFVQFHCLFFVVSILISSFSSFVLFNRTVLIHNQQGL